MAVAMGLEPAASCVTALRETNKHWFSSPGSIDAPAGFERSGLSKEAIEEFARNIGTKVPMKRLGQTGRDCGSSRISCIVGRVFHDGCRDSC